MGQRVVRLFTEGFLVPVAVEDLPPVDIQN
jgi:hypothetical protein